MNCNVLRTLAEKLSGKFFENESACVVYFDRPVRARAVVDFDSVSYRVNNIFLEDVDNVSINSDIMYMFMTDVEAKEYGIAVTSDRVDVYRVSGNVRRIVIDKRIGKMYML